MARDIETSTELKDAYLKMKFLESDFERVSAALHDEMMSDESDSDHINDLHDEIEIIIARTESLKRKYPELNNILD